MTETLIPPWVLPETPERIKILDDGTTLFQPQFSRGNAQVQIWNDPRWQFIRRYKGMRLDGRGMLETAIHDARGKGQNVRMTPHRPRRGSFPAVELLTNNSFEGDVTTGWTSASSASMDISASDRRMRLTRTGVVSTTLRRSSAAAVTANAAYCARAFLRAGRGVQAYSCDIGSTASASDYAASGTLADQILAMSAGVVLGSTAFFNMLDSGTGKMVGDFAELIYASLARCALVDNQSNYVLRGGQIDNAAWGKTNVTVTASATLSPNNQSIAEGIKETVTNGVHAVTQTIAVPATTGLDITIGAAFKADGRNFCRVVLFDDTSTDSAGAYFDLSNGTVGTAALSGTVYTNLRTAIEPLGDGWYACYVTARKTTAITAPIISLRVASANGTQSYAGNVSNGVFLWGVTGSASGVPIRLAALSATSSPTPDTLQSGNGINIKALPVSTNGLLMPGDWIEINGELKAVTQPLNSSAAGLGYLQFRPAIVTGPADNQPVVIHEPFGRFKLMNGADLDNLFGTYTDVELELTEFYA